MVVCNTGARLFLKQNVSPNGSHVPLCSIIKARFWLLSVAALRWVGIRDWHSGRDTVVEPVF